MNRAISAKVAQSNTKETDMMPEVMHIVTVSQIGGGKANIKIMAACPMTAISKVNEMSDAEVDSLIIDAIGKEAIDRFGSTLKNLGND